MQRRIGSVIAIGLLGAVTATPAVAEKVNVAIGQLGLWDTMVTVIGTKKGWYKEKGLEINYIKTRGGADTIRAITAGDMHIGMSNGILGAIAAYKKGLPVRVISSEMIGADMFWIVRADSRRRRRSSCCRTHPRASPRWCRAWTRPARWRTWWRTSST